MSAHLHDALACLLAIALDASLRLPNALHPVAWFGALAGAISTRAPLSGRVLPGLSGLAIAVVLPLLAAGFALLVLRGAERGPWPLLTSLLAKTFLLASCFSLFGLLDAGARLAHALRHEGLPAARARLSWLCSRDASQADETALAGGAIESLAENLSDSVVAPLGFALCFGVPGAACYRAINTLDAMIGYHGRYEWLGKASARLDDLANLLPARVTALALLAAGALLPRKHQVDTKRGAAVLLADRARTESPNAGWPMALAAGQLGVRLDKPGAYVLGAALPPPSAADVDRAVVLVRAAGLLFLACVLALVARFGLGVLLVAR